MLRKTLRKWVWFAFLAASSAGPGAAGQTRAELLVTISVHNDAKIPLETLTKAEAVSSRIFGQAGLQVNWVNCALPEEPSGSNDVCTQSAFPKHLQLRILGHPRSLTRATFGVSYLSEEGIGCYSEVFFGRIAELQQGSRHSAAIVLGHVMAHEIAHLLLGTNSHSSVGIMSAHWQPEELALAAKGVLFFTRPQSELMRERLSAAMAARSGNAVSAAVNVGK